MFKHAKKYKILRMNEFLLFINKSGRIINTTMLLFYTI
jgi:hypothetical protein